MSFCRITGRARSLPKPNFFPIIPPISPADARRLCRITGKRMDGHNYLPLLELGKRPECVRCTITGKNNNNVHENKSPNNNQFVHSVRNDFKYVTPILRKEAMEAGDAKAFEDLQKVLKRLKKGLSEEDKEKMYVYMLPSVLCGLIVPAEVEEAIKMGEMESVSLSKTCDKAIFKIRGKPTLFIPLKEVDIKTTASQNLLDGLGQSKETLSKQKKILEEKKKRTLANKKIFEDLERQADEELQKDIDRPKGSGRMFGAGKSKEAKEYRQKLLDFMEMYLPKGNMAVYGPNWRQCLFNLDMNTLDWAKIDKVKQIDLDTALPKMAKLKAIEDNQIFDRKRQKNVYIPDGQGLEIVPYLEGDFVSNQKDIKLPEGLQNYIQQSRNNNNRGENEDDFNTCWSLKSMFASVKDDAIKILPTLSEFISAMTSENMFIRKGCIYDSGDGPKFCESSSSAPKDSNVIIGAIFKVMDQKPKKEDEKKMSAPIIRFFPGIFLDDGTFIPGQRMASVKGEFIPGASLRSAEGTFQFIPGVVTSKQFVAGQFIGENNDINFVHGEVVHTKTGSKFVEGETVLTPDGLKFVAGLMINNDNEFVPGTIIDEGSTESKFVPGLMISEGEDVVFIPGEMGKTPDDTEVFIPGLRVDDEFRPGQMIDRNTFMYGELIVTAKGQPQFLPGIYNNSTEDFTPGVVLDMGKNNPSVFVEGKLFNNKDTETLFVPGQTKIVNEGKDNRFDKCKNISEIRQCKSPSPPPMAIDGEGLALVFKKIKPKNGTMVVTPNGEEFFPEGAVIPSELIESGTAELVSGRMECTENGPQFVPGKVMEIHGIRTFIPGKMIKDEVTGENVFVPGKMIDGKNGPRFWPGQVIESEDGDEKFIPGQVINDKFVPGIIVDKVFIPGQVLRTDNGLKFVPGLIVEHPQHGALFAPGKVIETREGMRLVPGTVVDTPEGPRLLPPDIKGDGIDLDYVVQGFDIDQIEARLILGGKWDGNSDGSDILDGIGGASIGSEALKALAEGFQNRKGNAIVTIGEDEDVDKLLQDEMLDSCDSPAVRKVVRSVFSAVFDDLCKRLDNILDHMNSYVNGCLNGRLDSTLLSDMKLNPAIEKLKRMCGEKGPNDPEEFDIMNLVAGIITCSVPGALKECCSDNSNFEDVKFKAILLSCIEDSIRGILEEDGTISNGLMDDIKELVNLAKELEFDENQSFFSKVEAVTEGRCNSKFMDTLLKNLKTATTAADNQLQNLGGTNELLARLINILAPRLHLQSGFKEMCSNNPEFVQEVLECLKGDPADIEGFTAIDILHHAITKVINNRCQRHLDDVVHKVELDSLVMENDHQIRAMLEQAIGLAKYMGKSDVVDMLFELLGDPIRLEAIRDDPIIKDVLNKILVMQKLTAKDTNKRQKLEKLQRYHRQSSAADQDDSDDSSLRELIRICDALTRPPNQGKLKKSKSMVKKSKSMIMTAKDIPMNAFMAMKNSAAEKDEKWLQNFLSESLVDDIPWECSKALIILKEGYQAIIPREASRSILLGEASYTLIDDNGVEFYLSPKDKMNRRKQGLDDSNVKKVTLNDEPIHVDNDKSIVNGTDNRPTLQDRVDYSAQESLKDDSTTISNGFDSSKLKYERHCTDFSTDGYASTNTRIGNGNRRLPPAGCYDDNMDDDDALMSSLEKYRPSAYDIGRPKEDDDINNIRDYYTNMMTRQRAINRYGGAPLVPNRSTTEFEVDSAEANGNGYSNGRRTSFDSQNDPYFDGGGYGGPPAAYRQPSQSYQRPANMPVPQNELAESSRYLLDKAKSVRSRPMWEPERDKYDMFDAPHSASQSNGNYSYDRTCDFRFDRKSADAHPAREPEDSMLSSRTRSLLDKVKESTAALSNMNNFDEFDQKPSSRRYLNEEFDENPSGTTAGRKPSRFLKRHSIDQQQPPTEISSSNGAGSRSYGVSRMADDILGENLYPPRDEIPKSSLRRSNNPTRKHSYQSSLDTDRFSDRSSPESRTGPSHYDRSETTKKFDADDEDLDAMINSLKQKTSGRQDMYKIIGDIEGDASFQGGRRSISPIPRGRSSVYDNPPEREPIRAKRQTSQSRVFDPYEQVRGGTGYNFDFEQPTSRPPTSQPSMGRYQSPQMLNSYPYSQPMPHQGMPQGPPQMQPMSYQTRSQPYGFRSQQQQQQPPPQMMGYGARTQPPFGYYYEG